MGNYEIASDQSIPKKAVKFKSASEVNLSAEQRKAVTERVSKIRSALDHAGYNERRENRGVIRDTFTDTMHVREYGRIADRGANIKYVRIQSGEMRFKGYTSTAYPNPRADTDQLEIEFESRRVVSRGPDITFDFTKDWSDETYRISQGVKVGNRELSTDQQLDVTLQALEEAVTCLNPQFSPVVRAGQLAVSGS